MCPVIWRTDTPDAGVHACKAPILPDKLHQMAACCPMSIHMKSMQERYVDLCLQLGMQDCWHAVPRMRPSFTDIIARLENMLQRWSQQLPQQQTTSTGSPPAARVAAEGRPGAAGQAVAVEIRPAAGVHPAARGPVAVPRAS